MRLKMSSSAFLRLLGELNYPGISSLDETSVEWMFDEPALLPLLTWFCSNVRPDNILTRSELQEFASLAGSSEGILEGEQLDDVLHNMSNSDTDDLTLEHLQAEVNMLEAEVAACEANKTSLTTLRSRMSMQQLSLAERMSRLDTAEAVAKSEYKRQLENAAEDNTRVNSCVGDLAAAVGGVMRLYEDAGRGTQQERREEEAMFISQLDLRCYHTSEEKFGSQLSAFTRRQFFEGIAAMTTDSEGTRYEFLEISKPTNLLVRGERSEVNLDECKELARLHAIFPRSECERVNAVVEHASTYAACLLAEEKARQINMHAYPSTIHELSNCLSDAEQASAAAQRDLTGLSEHDMPTLVQESSALQVTRILRGNYDLKIARQDYFTNNQDQLIRELVCQQSRHDLLTMALELELRSHRDTHRLLTAVSLLLNQTISAAQVRQRCMEDALSLPQRHKRSTIDSRDHSILALNEILKESEETDKSQLFVSYSGLLDNASSLQKKVTTMRNTLTTTNSNHDEKLDLLEDSLNSCESLLYAGCTTRAGPPPLQPHSLLDAITKLSDVLLKLEKYVLKNASEIEQKKKSLTSLPLQNTERDLFVYFYNDKDKLRRSLADVRNRLQANKLT